MTAAVIFDLDGVLVDSEQVWDQARRDVVAEHGGTWRPSATRDMLGMSSPEWSRYMHDELGVPADPRYETERAAAVDALPGADVVTADEELMVRHDDPGAAACAAAVLALRFDFAALYLGLGRGVLGGPGWAGSTLG